jgi:hypothetical protein
MDWFMSAMMIAFYWLTGNKWKHIWIMSMAVNLIWVGYAILIKQYGLIPSSIIILGVSVRNHFKWRTK